MPKFPKHDATIDPRTPQFCERFCGYNGGNENFGTASKRYQTHLETKNHKKNTRTHWDRWIQDQVAAPSSQFDQPGSDETGQEDPFFDDSAPWPDEREDESQEAPPQDHSRNHGHADVEDLDAQDKRPASVDAAREIFRLQDQTKTSRIIEQGQELLAHIESFRGHTVHWARTPLNTDMVWSPEPSPPSSPLSEESTPLAPEGNCVLTSSSILPNDTTPTNSFNRRLGNPTRVFPCCK